MTIGIALLGAGLFARDAHLPAIQASSSLDLKAIYSRSLKSAQALAPDLTIDRYSDDSPNTLDTLLSRSDIQAVIIVLPIGTQTKYIRAALSAGKHVLSEKPIAEKLSTANDLITWYRSEISPKVTWSVAEDWRFWDALEYALEPLAKIGKISQFRGSFYLNVVPGSFLWPFIETPWRKNPTHQGGFLLDSNVHFLAALRFVLGKERVSRLSAFTGKFGEYLPPVDTLDAVMRTESGAQGTFQVSACSSLEDGGFTVVGQNGHVTVSQKGVNAKILGVDQVKEFPQKGLGVHREVEAWGEALVSGEVNGRQLPEEGLADLELIELMLRSAEADGAPQVTKHQNVQV